MKMQPALFSIRICLLLLMATGAGAAQSTSETAKGIPINDPLVISKCAGCHARDANGMMGRISYIRTTPEVWDQILKRMIRLNGLIATPDESRHLLRYLSNNNGLAPQEARPVFWEVEHRLFRTQEEEAGVPAELQQTCNQCHTIGRVLSQRRTAADYVKLTNTHMALFPGAEPMVFRPADRNSHPEDTPVTTSQLNEYETKLNYPASPAKPDTKYPIDIALEYLAKNQPLITPEWAAWKETIVSPKLEGTWTVSAYQPGKGKVFGEMTITAGPTADDFVTKTVLHYPDGQAVSVTGKGVVYSRLQLARSCDRNAGRGCEGPCLSRRYQASDDAFLEWKHDGWPLVLGRLPGVWPGGTADPGAAGYDGAGVRSILGQVPLVARSSHLRRKPSHRIESN